jgi:spore coat protein U-like protein
MTTSPPTRHPSRTRHAATIVNFAPSLGRGLRNPGALVGVGFAAVLVLGLALRPAAGATSTGSIAVSSTAQATCVNATTPLAFGVYTGVVNNSTATVTVTCTNTTPYTVGLGPGLGTGATVTTRAMTGTAPAVLHYILTSDAAHAVNWGVTIGTDTVAGTGNGAGQVLTVYGQVTAGQYPAPGAYTDTVAVTVTY